MWSIELPFFTELRQDLTGLHRVTPNVVSMAGILEIISEFKFK